MKTPSHPADRAAPGPLRARGARGSILGLVLIILVIVSILSFGLMSLAGYNAMSTGKEISAAQAFWAADAGLEDAKAFAIKKKKSFADAGWLEPHVRTVGTAQYAVAVQEQLAGPAGERLFSVTSTGISATGTTRILYLTTAFWPVQSGLFGANWVEFDGTTGAEGFVRSNGDINLSGSARIVGDAIPGPGYYLSDGEAAKVTGSVDPAPELFVLTPIVVPPPPYESVPGQFLNAQGALDLTGADKTVTLSSSGNYLFTGIFLTAQSSIVVPTGVQVVVYCSGAVDTGGGAVVNQSHDADSFQLCITSTGSTVDLNLKGGSEFYGHVYAPNADCTLRGNSNFYGSLICGGTATLKGGATFKQSGAVPGDKSLPWFSAWKQQE